ncbi:ATP/GTP-binding protein [Adhaeribacter swui]|uniref:ATP/GTP-binding protein n=1 Tax=Adhaeribacter swui TaxID=2086471 RepID=A0A7G7G999_9BACT|nr:ATP/GTP-binding protein [Adhaeribacter swui]QNF33733.1 ATP/GTP-binding protein [Adhaeribacter swui]
MNKNHLVKSCLMGALLLGFTQISNLAVAQTVSLVKKWETPATLKEPESVLYDKANKVLYASNINNPAGNADGNGSIARIALNGKIEKVEWVVGGMDSPKGLGLSKGLLYVADLTKVVVIDVKTAKLVRTIPVKDAGMLNDITVDAQGVVYVSDSDKKRVYRLNNNQAEVWLEKDHFQKPNGLLAHQNKFYMIDMTAGIFYEVNKNTKELRKIAEGLIGGDGIIPYGKDFIISNWNGEINYVTAAGQVTKLLDTKAEKVNAADIEYIPEQNLLLVPTFFANKVVAYEVKK